MSMHLRADSTFVQDDAWYEAQDRYYAFIKDIPEKPTLLLEFGVGWNTPVWIRMPFERIASTTKSPLIRMNFDDAAINGTIPVGVCLKGDIAEIFPMISR